MGKVEGWQEDMLGYDPNISGLVGGNGGAYGVEYDGPEWKLNMLKMIDALAEGKTIEEYLETL